MFLICTPLIFVICWSRMGSVCSRLSVFFYFLSGILLLGTICLCCFALLFFSSFFLVIFSLACLRLAINTFFVGCDSALMSPEFFSFACSECNFCKKLHSLSVAPEPLIFWYKKLEGQKIENVFFCGGYLQPPSLLWVLFC